MRNLFLSTVAALVLVSGAASAQGLRLNTGAAAVEPTTGLKATEWVNLMANYSELNTFVGQPWLIIFNATPTDITVSCDDKWQLVGDKPYWGNNPHVIHAWKYAPIYVKDFDGYCSKSLVGTAVSGFNHYSGILEVKGNFSQSRYIAFIAQ